MKYRLFIVAALLGAATMASTEANAVVCARGVVRAGCAGPNGAVVVARPVVVAPRAVVVTPRPVVVAPRAVVVTPAYRACRYVNGVRVCR